MHETGADFTNAFRWLVEVPLPEASSGRSNPVALDNGQSSASAPEQNGAGASSSGMSLSALTIFTINHYCCGSTFCLSSTKKLCVLLIARPPP